MMVSMPALAMIVDFTSFKVTDMPTFPRLPVSYRCVCIGCYSSLQPGASHVIRHFRASSDWAFENFLVTNIQHPQ